MKNILSGLIITVMVFAMTLAPALAQTTNTDSNNTTTTTDNSQDNDDINKEKVVVICKIDNEIDDSANAEADNDGDVESDGDNDVDQEADDADVDGDGDASSGSNAAEQTITQETTVDQLPSVVADFQQRGCDITVNYKTSTPLVNQAVVQPTPIVVTNTIERVVDRSEAVNVPVPQEAPIGGRG